MGLPPREQVGIQLLRLGLEPVWMLCALREAMGECGSPSLCSACLVPALCPGWLQGIQGELLGLRELGGLRVPSPQCLCAPFTQVLDDPAEDNLYLGECCSPLHRSLLTWGRSVGWVDMLFWGVGGGQKKSAHLLSSSGVPCPAQQEQAH